nr:hypothetical protein CFP56_10117 [Quercus suber]
MAGPTTHSSAGASAGNDADSFTPFINSRKKPRPTGDEEATSQLRLGELENTPALSVAECNELLNRLEANSQRVSDKPIYTKTREYVGMFSRFKDSNTVTQVDAICSKLLEEHGFTQYEKAQIGQFTLLEFLASHRIKKVG